VTVHTKVGFTKLFPGTVCPSLILSQIRQLCDKALSYLKKVIGTPAVYEPLYRLNPVFGYSHWAGIRDHTILYKFAIPYVFEKQSRTLGFKNFFTKVTIIPKFVVQFAEFPRKNYVLSLSLLN